MKRIRILFNVWADADNVNAQSLNAREIALRLNPDRFMSTLFHREKPDPRMIGRRHIRLKRLPPRLGSLVIAREMIWGRYDILFYVFPNRAGRIFWRWRHLGPPKKVIATVEGTAAQIQAIPDGNRAYYLEYLRRADAGYAITEYIAQSMHEAWSMRMPVIPVGVNLEIFRPVDRSPHTSPCKVLFVGSIQPRKQPHLILELARCLRAEPVEFHLIGGLIGDPAYRSLLLADWEQHGLNNVYFHEPMPQEEVQEWMARCDVFLLPSRLEGLPKVTLEAAATGLPCIVFDDYHTPSVIDGVTGFQVRTFEEMLDRLRLLIADRDLRLRMGAAAVEHARKFDWDIIAKRWEAVLEEIAQTNPVKTLG